MSLATYGNASKAKQRRGVLTCLALHLKKMLELRLRDTPPTWLRVRPCQPRQHRQNKMHSMHAQPDPHQVAVALRCGPSHLLLPILRLVCVGVNTEATNDRVLHAANIENSLRCAMRVAGVIYTSTYARCAWKLRCVSLWSRISHDCAGQFLEHFAMWQFCALAKLND